MVDKRGSGTHRGDQQGMNFTIRMSLTVFDEKGPCDKRRTRIEPLEKSALSSPGTTPNKCLAQADKFTLPEHLLLGCCQVLSLFYTQLVSIPYATSLAHAYSFQP